MIHIVSCLLQGFARSHFTDEESKVQISNNVTIVNTVSRVILQLSEPEASSWLLTIVAFHIRKIKYAVTTFEKNLLIL